MAATASATTSSACRRTTAAAVASPSAATSNRTGVSSRHRASVIAPRCTAAISSAMVPRPKWRGSAVRRRVSGPRPSSARAAHHIASCQRCPPPPQSPEMWPTAAKRTGARPGSTPEQLIPAPQTTAMPRGSSTPARRTAKVSLKTSLESPHPWAATACSSASCSGGRSALAKHAATWCTTGPAPSGTTPASAHAARTIGARPSTAASAPTRWGRKGPPRAVPTSRPSVAISATSVLLLPGVDREDARRSVRSLTHVRPTAGSRGCGRPAGRRDPWRGRPGRREDAPAGPGTPARSRRGAQPRAPGARTP